MNLGNIIENIIDQQGRTKVWVADKCDINYKTFVDKLKNDRLTAYDLIKLGDTLNIDLNTFKSKER